MKDLSMHNCSTALVEDDSVFVVEMNHIEPLGSERFRAKMLEFNGFYRLRGLKSLLWSWF